MKGLPRLNAAVLSFDRGFTSDGPEKYHYWDFPQTPKFRFKTMHRVFSLLESLQHPIQDLGIRNLQADNPKDSETLEKMAKVLSGLVSLRLGITNETNDAAPENDLEVKHSIPFCIRKNFPNYISIRKSESFSRNCPAHG